MVVCVGDGPLVVMEELDKFLPKRKLDNYHFVDYHKVTNKTTNSDTTFALHALMEIADKFKGINALCHMKEREQYCLSELDGIDDA